MNVYHVESVDVHQYDTIKRLTCTDNNTYIVIDVHRHLFQCKQRDKLKIVFTNPIHSTNQLATRDDYGYCMNGTILEACHTGTEYTIYASFGGLMMVLRSATDLQIQKNFAVCLSVFK
jgi:hypothetical protein